MADHGLLGDELGHLVKSAYAAITWRDATTDSVSIPSITKLLADAEALFDIDTTGKLLLPQIIAMYQGWRQSLNGMVAGLTSGPFAAWVSERLRVEIDTPAVKLGDILRDHVEQMLIDSKEVQKNVVAVGAVSADANNEGDGTVVVSILDPLTGTNNERVQPADWRLVCRSDSFDGGRTPGSEEFELQCTKRGTIGRVRVKHAESGSENRISNSGFESWDLGTLPPDDWTLGTGTLANTHVLKETSILGRGLVSLEFNGDATLATLELKQPETAWAGYGSTVRVKPKKRYLLSARIKTDGIAAGDTFTMQLSGTGYTPGATEKIAIAGASTVDWTYYSAVILLPKAIPSDLALSITLAGTPPASTHVYVDDVCFQEMTFFEVDGIALAVFRGQSDFVASVQQDYFTFATTNDYAGRFQTFLTQRTNEFTTDRRLWPSLNQPWPSDVAASAEYAEAKAGG